MIADDGFYFGLGAFETVALEEGTPIFLNAHFERLEKTLSFLQIPVTMEQVRHRTEDFLRTAQEMTGRKALKITVTQQNILCTMRENPYRAEDYLRGFDTEFSAVRRKETSPLTGHKTHN